MKIVCPDFMRKENEKYFVCESGNFHLTKNAPNNLIQEMRKYRMQCYGDENVYGEKDYNGTNYKYKIFFVKNYITFHSEMILQNIFFASSGISSSF